MRAGLLVAPAAALLLAVPPAAAAPRTHTVVIDKMRFGPMPAEMSAGDTILWVNRDFVPHTATVKGAFDLHLKPGESSRTTVRKSGAIQVTCRFHPGMRATLRVKGR